MIPLNLSNDIYILNFLSLDDFWPKVHLLFWPSLDWFPNKPILNEKFWITNIKLLVKTHDSYYWKSDTANQSQSTPLLKVLAARRRWLGLAFQNPKTYWNQQSMSAQDLLHNKKRWQTQELVFVVFLSPFLLKSESDLTVFVMMNWKHRFKNNQALMRSHAR